MFVRPVRRIGGTNWIGCSARAHALEQVARVIDTQLMSLSDLHLLGTTLVVAPHPDDETLGCGGLIALLRRCGQPVYAVLVSDGSQSHPGSFQFDAMARRAVRAEEWQQALACLGVAPAHLHHLDWPDGQVPGPGDPRFAAGVQHLRGWLSDLGPNTVLLPWRRDPHPDHRATHALFAGAMRGLRLRCLEYTVWLGERAAPGDEPRPGEVRAWRLDIRPVLAAKQQAVACHRSQLGQVFVDDDKGFVLPSSLLAQARMPFEHYFEGRLATLRTPGTPRTPKPSGTPETIEPSEPTAPMALIGSPA